MKKKRWLCLLTAILISWLLGLSASAAHNPNEGTYQGTVDQIYLAIHDQEGEWPAEPSIADHKYLFLVRSQNGIRSGGSGSVQFDTKASTYISTTAFQNLYRSSVKTSGSSGGRVTGLSKPAGMDGTEGFWTKDGFQTLTDLKSEIIRVYLQNRTSGTKIKNPTDAQIAQYDVLIYVVKYEEYYNSDGSVTKSNSGYHVDCAVVKKTDVKITYDANLPDGYSIADGVGLPNNKTVSRNTGETALDSLSYSSESLRGEEIQNSAGQTGRFLGWSLTANGTDADLITSINVGTSDVTVYAIWSIEEEEPEQPGGVSVQKTVMRVGGVAVAQDDDGDLVIPTAYPGYEIVWEITVNNNGSTAASFTLTDALLEKGASVYDENGDPVVVSGTLWTTDTIPVGGSSRYTVRYTLTEEDLSASGLINTVILDEEESSAEVVQTKAYPVYVYFRTLLVSEDGSAQAAKISGVNYNDSSDGSWATLGWITDILPQQPADQYSETSYESGLQVAKSAVNGDQFTAYGGNESWLSSVQWEELIASYGANGLGGTEVVTEPEGRLAWHLNGSVSLCELTYDGNADEVSNVPDSAYLVQNTESQISDQTPYRAGYVFTGWNTKPDGTGTAYAAGDTITLLASDTLYAQWTETTASFDLNDMGGSPVIKKHLDGEPSASYQETFRVTVTQLPMQRPLTLDTEETADAGSTMTGYASISADTLTAGFLFKEEQHILTFNAAGTYLYQIQEVAGSHSRVTYDDTVYQLQITVNQTDDGTLRITDWQFLLAGKESLGAYLTITNTYTAASGGGGGEGGTSKPILVKPTVKEYLNTEDHFAYLVGYSDGTIRPNGSITRAEVATIFFRLLNDDVREENLTRSNSFTDVSRGDWYNTAVSTMAAIGILDGYSDGSFRPDAPITRAEFAAIAARFDESAASGSASFSDLSGHWAAEEISRAYQNGWVTGYSDGTFRPDQSITRAEAVTLINRVLERELPDDAELLDDMNVWSDNLDSKKWYYLDMQEASNSHAYTRNKKDVESWVKLRTDPDWTSYED